MWLFIDFGLLKIYYFEPNISPIKLFSLFFNYTKTTWINLKQFPGNTDFCVTGWGWCDDHQRSRFSTKTYVKIKELEWCRSLYHLLLFQESTDYSYEEEYVFLFSSLCWPTGQTISINRKQLEFALFHLAEQYRLFELFPN